jgi:hypothetical protein
VKRNQLVSFGDVNSDGICDVKDNNGVVYLGGVTVVLPPPPSDPGIPCVSGDPLEAAASTLAAAGYVRGTVSSVVDQICEYIGVVACQTILWCGRAATLTMSLEQDHRHAKQGVRPILGFQCFAHAVIAEIK